MPKDEKPVLVWDECEIVESQTQFILETIEDFPWYKECTEEEIREAVSADHDTWEFEWEWMTDALTELMAEKAKRFKYFGHWFVVVCNFGWRELHGCAFINALTGEELLREILPKTDCTFKIFHDGRRAFKIQNFHHDSPVGNEWYFVRPMTAKQVERQERRRTRCHDT